MRQINLNVSEPNIPKFFYALHKEELDIEEYTLDATAYWEDKIPEATLSLSLRGQKRKEGLRGWARNPFWPGPKTKKDINLPILFGWRDQYKTRAFFGADGNPSIYGAALANNGQSNLDDPDWQNYVALNTTPIDYDKTYVYRQEHKKTIGGDFSSTYGYNRSIFRESQLAYVDNKLVTTSEFGFDRIDYLKNGDLWESGPVNSGDSYTKVFFNEPGGKSYSYTEADPNTEAYFYDTAPSRLRQNPQILKSTATEYEVKYTRGNSLRSFHMTYSSEATVRDLWNSLAAKKGWGEDINLVMEQQNFTSQPRILSRAGLYWETELEIYDYTGLAISNFSAIPYLSYENFNIAGSFEIIVSEGYVDTPAQFEFGYWESYNASKYKGWGGMTDNSYSNILAKPNNFYNGEGLYYSSEGNWIRTNSASSYSDSIEAQDYYGAMEDGWSETSWEQLGFSSSVSVGGTSSRNSYMKIKFLVPADELFEPAYVEYQYIIKTFQENNAVIESEITEIRKVNVFKTNLGFESEEIDLFPKFRKAFTIPNIYSKAYNIYGDPLNVYPHLLSKRRFAYPMDLDTRELGVGDAYQHINESGNIYRKENQCSWFNPFNGAENYLGGVSANGFQEMESIKKFEGFDTKYFYNINSNGEKKEHEHTNLVYVPTTSDQIIRTTYSDIGRFDISHPINSYYVQSKINFNITDNNNFYFDISQYPIFDAHLRHGKDVYIANLKLGNEE